MFQLFHFHLHVRIIELASLCPSCLAVMLRQLYHTLVISWELITKWLPESAQTSFLNKIINTELAEHLPLFFRPRSFSGLTKE